MTTSLQVCWGSYHGLLLSNGNIWCLRSLWFRDGFGIRTPCKQSSLQCSLQGSRNLYLAETAISFVWKKYHKKYHIWTKFCSLDLFQRLTFVPKFSSGWPFSPASLYEIQQSWSWNQSVMEKKDVFWQISDTYSS